MEVSGYGRKRIRTTRPSFDRVCGTYSIQSGSNPPSISRLGDTYQGDTFGREVTEDGEHPMFFLWNRYGKGVAKGETLEAVTNSFYFRYLKTGGPFRSVKTTFGGNGVKVSLKRTGFLSYTYDGRLSPVQPALCLDFPEPVTDSYLTNLGASLINSQRPDKPMVGLSQDIAELKREGLPSLPGLQVLRDRNLSSLGKEHLGAQFGWKPIIQDVYNMADVIARGDAVMQKYWRQGNKLVRRHYEFPEERTVVVDHLGTYGGVYPAVTTGNLISNQTSDLIRTRQIIVKRRFSAAYKYWVPRGDQNSALAARKVLELKKKYGLEIDPALLWELTPWSWFVDWFVPVGKFITAASSFVFGNSACPWAFVSEHYRVIDTYERPLAICMDGTPVGPLVVHYDVKRRIPASPFGFNLDWNGFNSWQLGILAALGITR